MADPWLTREEMEREISHLKELLDERDRATARALELQAAEYSRRLDAISSGEEARHARFMAWVMAGLLVLDLVARFFERR